MCRKWFIGFCLSVMAFGVLAKQNAVVTAHPLATQAGMDVLEKGGNAFDAAIAVSAALSVVEPYHSGIGGGGFWLCREAQGKSFVIDGREVAPENANPTMYIGVNQKLNQKLSKQGALSAAIPGEVAAWEILMQKGRLSLAETLAPAIALAENGFVIDTKFAEYLQFRQKVLKQYPASQKIFFTEGVPLKAGAHLIQKDLANLLKTLAKEGLQSFYHGDIAQNLVQAVNQAGGIWTLADLKNYNAVIRKPIQGDYHDMTITTVGPPSAGGIGLLNALNILALYEMSPLSEADKVHLTLESLRRSFCDRAHYIGDPNFVDVPWQKLISQSHARQWQRTIDINRATPSQALDCGVATENKGETTHYIIKDTSGNLISATTTINFPFGSGLVADGLGIVLNNEMDDFAANIGGHNGFGLINTQVNTIQPKSRPVSSMTPVMVETAEGVALLGTPGGSRIPSMMLLAILEMEDSSDPTHWVEKARFHHQYLPDLVFFEEKAFDIPMQKALLLRGHKLRSAGKPYGNMQALYWDKDQDHVWVASDPRGIGQGAIHAVVNQTK